MTTALVTGGQGFVGWHLVNQMSSLGYQVVSLARDNKGRPIPKNVTMAYGDLRDSHFTDRIISEYDPDIVLHIAAVAIVSSAQMNPAETFTSNVIGSLNLLESCKRMSRKRIFYLNFGTDKQLGNGNMKTEQDPNPPLQELGPYEMSKVYSEILAKRYSDILMDVCMTRCANIYGPMDTHSRIVPNLIRELLSGKNPRVFIEDKPSTRQYIHVSDVASAIGVLVRQRRTGIYHIGTSAIKTQEEVANTILHEAGDLNTHYSTFSINHVRDEVRRKSYLWYIVNQSLDYSKIQKETGWEPVYSFENGIKDTIVWWMEQNKKWNGVQS